MRKNNILYLNTFGKAFIPKKFRPDIRKYFFKAGYDEIHYALLGLMFWISALLTYLIYVPVIYPKIKVLNAFLFFLWTFISWFLVQGTVASFLGFLLYFHLNLRIFQRTKLMEDKLPDYLNLVSVNIKGGLSFENSLWQAIRPEFDVLAKEITIVSKSVMTGNDIKLALFEFADKYDSPILKRTVDLIVGEVEGGGKIVDIIDSVVKDLKKTEALKNELRVATTTYMIFISVIVLLIAPALFAVSYQLLQMITGFTQDLSGNLQSVRVPLKFGVTNVSPEEFKSFSYFALGIISAFSSMILSIIQKGGIKNGLKYIPLFVIGASFMYYLFGLIIKTVFSGFVAF